MRLRTTLNLDADVLAYARAHAKREHISISKAVSYIALRGIQAESQSVASLPKPQSKYALLPARAEVITPEYVRTLME